MAQLDEIYVTSTYLIPWVIFLVALGGSAHCVGMCGGLVMAFTKTPKTNTLYQIGRLIGYLLLGYLASLLGSVVKEYFQAEWASLMAASFMGVMLIYWGVKTLLKGKVKFQLPGFFGKISKAFYKVAYRSNILNENAKSMLLGFLSIFLPCGFLYGAVLVLASFNSPLIGMTSMFTFWLGTVPALAFAPEIFKKILSPLKQKAPILSSICLISLGVITLGTRILSLYNEAGGGHCH